MTDKQLEEIRKRIQDREVGTNGACTHIYIDGEEADSGDIMFLIEQLVEEVEREAMKEGWNRAVLTVNDAEQERLKYLKKWLPIKAKEIETN